MYHSFTDLAIPGRGIPLSFARTYDSLAAGSTGPFGYGWTYSYNVSLTLDDLQNVMISQENSSQTTFINSGGTYAPAAPRSIATLVHNGDGTWTYNRLAREVLTFSPTGQLTQEMDLNGYATNLDYSGGQLSTIIDPAGRTLTVTWNGGRIKSVADQTGRTVLYGYNDGADNLTDVTDVAQGNWHFAYDPAHLMRTMVDPRGIVVNQVYDPSNSRVTSQTVDPTGLNRTTRFDYAGDNTSATGGTTTVTDPKVNVTVETYQYGLLVQKTQGFGTPEAATWTYAYDPATLGQTSITDPNGHVTTMTYDASGNLLTSRDPLNRTTTNTYDALNDLLTTTDPLVVTTTLKYDSAADLLSFSRPLTTTNQVQTTTYTYCDSAHPGDVTAMTDPDTKTWLYTYDTYGNRASTTDPVGDKTTFAYDTIGRVTADVTPNGNVTGGNPAQYTTSFTYDNFGNLLTATDPLSDVTRRTYDPDRNLATVTDARTNVTTYAYDNANEPTMVKRADNTTLKTDYNLDGTVLDQIDGKGNKTTYGYDALARVITDTDPLLRTTTYTYDGAGNLLTMTDPQGQVTTAAYDVANELTAISYSDGKTPNVTNVQYDADGQRTALTDGTGSSAWVYDSLHRLTSSTDGAANTVGYGYDLKGLLTSLIYPGNLTVTRGYDDAGRLTRIADWLGNATAVGYDADSDLTTQTFPVATTNVDGFTYDPADRLMAIADTSAAGTLGSFTYDRDANNQLSADNPTGVGQAPQAYGYNALNQLNGVNGGSYAYDAADNITQLTSGATLGYDAANQITQLALNGANTSFSFDLRGNRTVMTPTNGPPVTFGYDQANRLTAYNGIATYAYNGAGLRMSKTVNGTPEPFVWNVAQGLPLALKDGTTSYAYGPGGLPLEQVSASGTVLFDHHDQLGSTRLLTDASGSVVATYDYDAYGNPITPATPTPSATATPTPTTPAATATTTPTATTLTATISPSATPSPTGTATATPTPVQFALHGTPTTVTTTVGNWTVTLNIPAETPPIAQLSVSAPATPPAIKPPANHKQVFAIVVEGTDAQGNPIAQLSAPITISIRFTPTGVNPRLTIIYTIDPTTGQAQWLPTRVTDNGDGTFTATAQIWHLSPFVGFAPGPGTPVPQAYLPIVGDTSLAQVAPQRAVSQPQGNPLVPQTQSTQAVTNPFGYAGQYTDAESGLLYLRARYYDPSTAQFLTRDPMVAKTRVPYGYVAGSPLNASDPFGLYSGWPTSPMETANTQVNCEGTGFGNAVLLDLQTTQVPASPPPPPPMYVWPGLSVWPPSSGCSITTADPCSPMYCSLTTDDPCSGGDSAPSPQPTGSGTTGLRPDQIAAFHKATGNQALVLGGAATSFAIGCAFTVYVGCVEGGIILGGASLVSAMLSSETGP